MPGPKPRPKIPGTIDWNPRVTDIPESTIELIRIVSAKKSRPGSKATVGELLRDWIVAGAAKEAKKLKIEF